MAAVILLMPVKLLGKAMCHIAAALFGAVGFVLCLVGAISSKVGSFLGGLTLLSVIIALIFESSITLVLTFAGIAVAEILCPLIILAISGGMYAFRNMLLDLSEDIELF